MPGFLFLKKIGKTTIQLIKSMVLMMFLFILFPCEKSEFKQEDLEKLQSTNKCEKCNLSGADLSGAYFHESVLSGANLSKAKLMGTGFIYANLIRCIPRRDK